jgi:hypothetical protein
MVVLIDLPRGGETGCQPRYLIGPGKIPIDQPVECRKAEKAKTFAAIVGDPGGGRDVGGGPGDAQSLSKRRKRCRGAEQERDGDESRGKLAQNGRASRLRRKPAFWRLLRTLPRQASCRLKGEIPAIECSALRRSCASAGSVPGETPAPVFGPPHLFTAKRILLTAERILALPQGEPPRIFITKQEAKSSCPVPRNTGGGIFGHTSRRRPHRSPHAGYSHRNLRKIGGTARIGRPTEFRCARRGTMLSTNLQAPLSCAANVGHDRHAASRGQDQFGR